MVEETSVRLDLDCRALSNAGVWAVGKLQTDAERDRVIGGLSLAEVGVGSPKDLYRVVKKLRHRWFVFRDVQSDQGLSLLPPRWAYSFMRGPMTRAEIAAVRGVRVADRMRPGSCASSLFNAILLRS